MKKTLNELKNDISELNDFLADFYSEKSTKSREDYRSLLSETKDIVLTPKEMKNDFGFTMDIDNIFKNNSEYSLNKFNKKLNKEELNEQVRNATVLGLIRDFNLKNFEKDENLDNKNVDKVPNLSNDVTETKTNDVEINIGNLENMDGLNTETNNPNTPEKIQLTAGLSAGEVEKIQEEARIRAQAEIAEKNQKVYGLFVNYLDDADYRKEYQNCLNGMYSFEECQQRFTNLKALKDKTTFTPTVPKAPSLNFANLDDVVYALCLKGGINTKATNGVDRKLNYRKMTQEQITLRDMPLSKILLNYINLKRAEEKKPRLELDPDKPSYENATTLLNSITQSDLTNILTSFTTEIWVDSNSYYDLETILNMLDWHKVIDTNKVILYKNTTSITDSTEVPENGEFPSLTISVETAEFKAKKHGLKMAATFETLLNDRFETFKKSFSFLLDGIKSGFQKEFVKELVAQRKNMKSISDATSVKDALNKVRKVYYEEMTDVKGKHIKVEPKYLYANPLVAQAFLNFFDSRTDPNQLNASKPNEWAGNKIYNLDFVIDNYLDSSLKEIDETLYGTNKDDAYFIPEGAISYLSVTPNLSPTVVTEAGKFGLSQEIGAFVIYGIAFVDPELIVYVNTKKILEDEAKDIPVKVEITKGN